MIKFKQGSLVNQETGIQKDIVVKAATPNTVKDILIGGTAVLVGIIYLTVTAFKNGSQKYEVAEFQTLTDLGLITDYNETTNSSVNKGHRMTH